ncbi:MAG: hypothetical protein MUF49_22175, partial [Oculatellaceae cyanobacterium Prado106]|jgi:hypothetical protein|nr:hypothetical protein [Oculatellaceae cyanobacterium Prado106]
MGELLPRPPVYLTMLRQPIERVISGYEFMRRNVPSRDEAMPNHVKANAMTLKEYVSDADNLSMANSQTRHLSSSLYKDDPEQWLAIAQQHLQDFACFGLVERFQDSMALLAYTFGWNPLAEFQNLMVAPRRLKQDQLEPETLDIITQRNALDVTLYQFAQDLFEQRYRQMVDTLTATYGGSSTPDAAQLQNLLDHHYQRRVQEQAIAPQSKLIFDFNRAIAGSGWHVREGGTIDSHTSHTSHTDGPSQTPTFRWTGPGRLATLDLPLVQDQDLVMECCIINALSVEVLRSLTICANGHPLDLTVLFHHEQLTIVRGQMPQSLLASDFPFVRLSFECDRTLSPHDLNPNEPDTRRVGLAFSVIQIYPAVEQGEWGAIATGLLSSHPWTETLTFIQHAIHPGQSIFAPTLLQEQFLGKREGEKAKGERGKAKGEVFAPSPHLPISLSPHPPFSTLRNYTPTQLDNPHCTWAILHKGMLPEVGPCLLKLWLKGFVPVQANEVFVTFARCTSLNALPYSHPHIQPLYRGYIKYLLQQSRHPWDMLGNRLKYWLKQKSGRV